VNTPKERVVSWYWFMSKGAGNKRTVSTSNTRKRTERIKKYKEKGERDPFRRSSNPHSIGLALSLISLVRGGVYPRNTINLIKIHERENEIIKISQSICMQAHLPVRLPCYDLSPLSARATGDLYTFQSSIQNNYVFKFTFESYFKGFFIVLFTTIKNCNPFTLYHRLYFDLTSCWLNFALILLFWLATAIHRLSLQGKEGKTWIIRLSNRFPQLVRIPPSAFGFKHVFVVPSHNLCLEIEGYLILVYPLGVMV